MLSDPQALIVDDDPLLIDLLARILEGNGYRVERAFDGQEAIDRFEESQPDVVLLDLLMPGIPGLSVCSMLRSISQVPIMVISAVSESSTKLQAYEVGADDYLVKPVNSEELIVRLKALLRRSRRGSASSASVIDIGDWTVDLTAGQVFAGGKQVPLTAKEYTILGELASHPGQLVRYEDLLRKVWGPQYSDSTHYLHTHVSTLRNKMESPGSPRIRARAGLGYVLEVEEQSST